jgi:hypothetical protein
MSLEQALAENTAALNRLSSILQSGAIVPAGTTTPVAGETATSSTPAAEPAKRTRKAKEEPASQTPAPGNLQSGVNDGKRTSLQLQEGHPEGTRYFHIPSHRTVAAVKPGEVIPSLPGLEEIAGDSYTRLKAEYAAPVPPSGAAQSGAAAAAPASTTPAASPASPTASAQPQPASTATSPALDGPALTAKCQALHKAQGNPGLKQVLDKFAVTNVPGLIAKSAEYAAISAFIDSLLTPPAPVQPAEVNLWA